MYDRPDPEGAEPTPYLPAWLDGTPASGQRIDPQFEAQQYGRQQYGPPQAYGPQGQQVPQAYDHGFDQQYAQYEQQGTYDQGAAYDQGVTYDQQGYGGPYAAEYGAQYDARTGTRYDADPYDARRAASAATPSAARPAAAEPPPYEPVGRYLPAVPARRAEVARRAAEPAGEGRRSRGRDGKRGLGPVMRSVLMLAALACLGVFGYWGWSFYQGTPKTVEEGDCIAALSGDDVKPLDCSAREAKFMVHEIFKGTTDTKMCTVVLGATNPLVVDREGRSDVWCVGPR